MKKYLFSFFVLLSSIMIAQVGINTTTPNPETQLDVNGNTQLQGDLRFNNNPGLANQLLLSAGPDTPPFWGPQILGITALATGAINPPFDIDDNTFTFLDIVDPNINFGTSTAFANILGDLPNGVILGLNFTVAVEIRTGNVIRIVITNTSGVDLVNQRVSLGVMY